MTVSPNIPTFPGSPSPCFVNWADLKKDRYNLEMLFLSSHTGTHIDAPYHFVKNGKKIHHIPIQRFFGEVFLIPVKAKQNYEISKSDITGYEKKYGIIPNNSIIVFRTGWNSDLKRDNFFTQNPGISTSAAKYLVQKKTNLVGIDSPSIDAGKNEAFAAHHILLENDVLILENLVNLDKIRTTKFKLAAFPLKLFGATGSPVRAVAF